MTKFESIGVDRQYDATNKGQAVKSFQNSCGICCCSGMRLDCDRCAIAHAHNAIIAAFEIAAKARKPVPAIA